MFKQKLLWKSHTILTYIARMKKKKKRKKKEKKKKNLMAACDFLARYFCDVFYATK